MRHRHLERLQLFGDDVEGAVVLEQFPAHPEKRFTTHSHSIPLVDIWANDHVDHSLLVLQENEYRAFCRRRPLARNN